MTPTALTLFAATFAVVFALGLQSLNVNGGHRLLAALTSFAIGASNLVLFKLLPGPTSQWEIAAYLLGGPVGIVASMLVHPHLVRWMRGRGGATAQPASSKPTPPPNDACLAPGAVVALPPGGVAITFMGCNALEQLARDLLDPEALGHAATPEIRSRARQALGVHIVGAKP